MIYLEKIFLSFQDKVLGALEPHSMDSLGHQRTMGIFPAEKRINKEGWNSKNQRKTD